MTEIQIPARDLRTGDKVTCIASVVQEIAIVNHAEVLVWVQGQTKPLRFNHGDPVRVDRPDFIEVEVTFKYQLKLSAEGEVALSDPEGAFKDALLNLANVMDVQTEDGLYRFGSPDAEGENDHLADAVHGGLSLLKIQGQTAYQG